MVRLRSAVFLLALAACGDDTTEKPLPDAPAPDLSCEAWTQWGRASDHLGATCVAGQSMVQAPVMIAYDSLVEAEKEDAGGELLVHYQSPLTVGDDLYMMLKGGSYTACTHGDMSTTCDPYMKTSQTWSERGYHWNNGTLSPTWTFDSDWKPPPNAGFLDFEPMFQPAIAGDFIYVPMAGGAAAKVKRSDGTLSGMIQPYPADPDRYMTGPITADRAGNLYWNAVKLDHASSYGTDVVTADLIKVTAAGTVTKASYQSLVTGAPAATDVVCRGFFTVAQAARPWPPPDDQNGKVLPPAFVCGSQRPSWNIAPAIGADGTIYTVSRAHFSELTSFVVAVKPDLTPKWTRSLKNVLSDACGVSTPIDGTVDLHPNDCRVGTMPGLDQNTNELPSGRANDASSSSPVALPDGNVLYGSYTSYNGARGHLIKLSATGTILANYSFGWDVTPAIYQHDGTYSIITKDNQYRSGGPFFIRQLDANLQSEWQYTNASIDTDHPLGFEWCINAPAVDKNGVVYANSEDGRVYAIPQGGDTQSANVTSMMLQAALPSAYTPLAIDAQGRIVALNDGTMTIITK